MEDEQTVSAPRGDAVQSFDVHVLVHRPFEVSELVGDRSGHEVHKPLRQAAVVVLHPVQLFGFLQQRAQTVGLHVPLRRSAHRGVHKQTIHRGLFHLRRLAVSCLSLLLLLLRRLQLRTHDSRKFLDALAAVVSFQLHLRVRGLAEQVRLSGKGSQLHRADLRGDGDDEVGR